MLFYFSLKLQPVIEYAFDNIRCMSSMATSKCLYVCCSEAELHLASFLNTCPTHMYVYTLIHSHIRAVTTAN